MRLGAQHTIDWYEGARDALRPLFELAEDSPVQLDGYIDLGRVLVARDERGVVVGHVQLLQAGSDAVEIKSIAVRAGSRGQGIGRALVERAVAVSRADGASAVTVTTATADVENVRFYQRCGFRAAAVEQDAFTPAKGYSPDLAVDGVPVRDAIRFDLELGGGR
jgi:ribosomal protein S18 acetylase RimI-like enzyme